MLVNVFCAFVNDFDTFVNDFDTFVKIMKISENIDVNLHDIFWLSISEGAAKLGRRKAKENG